MQAFRIERDGEEVFELREKGEHDEWRPAVNAPMLTKIEAAIGWLDPKGHGLDARPWAVVAGIQEDGRMAFIEEVNGATLNALLKILVDLKDRYLLRRVYVDDTPGNITTVMVARQHPGLCHYPGFVNRYDEWQMTLPPETWDFYRDKHTTAALIGAGEELLSDMLGGFERFRNLRADGKLVIRAACPKIDEIKEAKPPFDELLKKPIVKAAIMLTNNMMRGTGASGKLPQRRAAYANLGG